MADERYKDIGGIVDCTIEECAELIHILSKVNRFGWKNWHPDDQTKTPNYELVSREIEDVDLKIRSLKKYIYNNFIK